MTMNFRVDLYIHHRQDNRLDEALNLLRLLTAQGVKMSKELDALTAEVEETKTIEQSAITLIQGLAEQIAAAKDDPAAILALSESLKAQSDALAAAISANTPAPPA